MTSRVSSRTSTTIRSVPSSVSEVKVRVVPGTSGKQGLSTRVGSVNLAS